MISVLKIPVEVYEELTEHLLSPDSNREEAAFLFVSVDRSHEKICFEVVETWKLRSADFDYHYEDYLELADEVRAQIIKRAHDIGTSLVEIHSHPFSLPAAFSFADRIGLKETVPHMWWRLNKRPYLAIVVAPSGFDALLWLDNPETPQRLDCVVVGENILNPTNNSLGGWNDGSS
ncbi:Mov34/MPN/PAD-1 family protein [uncultured Sneathiella sp.]|uniref:Mov34/MPN/PAD-1 family protein n=1 Tax=uncultured Sneathiella sp. TaxID=879315 RepID=UPI0025949FC0|nr:Mov34/MPN/PAD-1 family protein [uncultured Sneathiella sp.]